MTTTSILNLSLSQGETARIISCDDPIENEKQTKGNGVNDRTSEKLHPCEEQVSCSERAIIVPRSSSAARAAAALTLDHATAKENSSPGSRTRIGVATPDVVDSCIEYLHRRQVSTKVEEHSSTNIADKLKVKVERANAVLSNKIKVKEDEERYDGKNESVNVNANSLCHDGHDCPRNRPSSDGRSPCVQKTPVPKERESCFGRRVYQDLLADEDDDSVKSDMDLSSKMKGLAAAHCPGSTLLAEPGNINRGSIDRVGLERTTSERDLKPRSKSPKRGHSREHRDQDVPVPPPASTQRSVTTGSHGLKANTSRSPSRRTKSGSEAQRAVPTHARSSKAEMDKLRPTPMGHDASPYVPRSGRLCRSSSARNVTRGRNVARGPVGSRDMDPTQLDPNVSLSMGPNHNEKRSLSRTRSARDVRSRSPLGGGSPDADKRNHNIRARSPRLRGELDVASEHVPRTSRGNRPGMPGTSECPGISDDVNLSPNRSGAGAEECQRPQSHGCTSRKYNKKRISNPKHDEPGPELDDMAAIPKQRMNRCVSVGETPGRLGVLNANDRDARRGTSGETRGPRRGVVRCRSDMGTSRRKEHSVYEPENGPDGSSRHREPERRRNRYAVVGTRSPGRKGSVSSERTRNDGEEEHGRPDEGDVSLEGHGRKSRSRGADEKTDSVSPEGSPRRHRSPRSPEEDKRNRGSRRRYRRGEAPHRSASPVRVQNSRNKKPGARHNQHDIARNQYANMVHYYDNCNQEEDEEEIESELPPEEGIQSTKEEDHEKKKGGGMFSVLASTAALTMKTATQTASTTAKLGAMVASTAVTTATEGVKVASKTGVSLASTTAKTGVSLASNTAHFALSTSKAVTDSLNMSSHQAKAPKPDEELKYDPSGFRPAASISALAGGVLGGSSSVLMDDCDDEDEFGGD